MTTHADESAGLFPRPEPSPSFDIEADLTGCALGWEGDGGVIYDARKWTQDAARADFAAEWSITVDQATVTARGARWLTTQEVWEQHGRECWMEQQISDLLDEHIFERGDSTFTEEKARALLAKRGIWQAPEQAPEDWEPDPEDEYTPAWKTLPADAPGAVLVYLCSEVDA